MRWKRINILIGVLCGIALPFVEVNGQAPMSEEQLRQWLESQMAATRFGLGSEDEALHAEWRRERGTWLSQAELDERWEEVKDYPDHPDRRIVEWNRELKEKPEVAFETLAFADLAAMSWVEERPDGAVLEAAGRGETRWRLYTKPGRPGTFIINRSGVPYPAQFGVSSFLRDSIGRLHLHVSYGLGSDTFRDSIVTDVSSHESRWFAEISKRDGDRTWRIEGRFFEGSSDTPIIISIEREARSWQFASHVREAEFERVVAREVTTKRNDGIETRQTLTALRRVRREDVEALASLPMEEVTERGIPMVDFRDPEGPAARRFADSMQMTWTLKDNVDQYEYETLSASTEAGGAPPNRSDASNNVLRNAALITTVLVIAVVSILLYWFKRQGEQA